MFLSFCTKKDYTFTIKSLSLNRDIPATNPSIIFHNGKLKCAIRSPGYLLWHSRNREILLQDKTCNKFLHFSPKESKTTNFLGDINPSSLELENVSQINWPKNNNNSFWKGVEDLKLISWNDKLYGTGVSRDFQNEDLASQEVIEFNEQDSIVNRKSLKNFNTIEKNWMPISDKPFFYLRWPNPGQVLEFNNSFQYKGIHKENTIPLVDEEWRGSSALINFYGMYLGIIHISHRWSVQDQGMSGSNSQYWHRFVVYDKDFNLVKATKPFCFLYGGTEFANGLEIVDDRFFISFGYYDVSAYLATGHINTLKEFIENE